MFNQRGAAPAQAQAPDVFSGIDSATTQGQRNPYLLPGQYHLKIDRVTNLNSRNNQLFFLVEMEILASDNNERPEGMRVTWMTNMMRDMGPVNAKRFLAAALGYDPETDEANAQITSQVARVACSDQNPLAGKELYAQCDMIKTRENKDFLNVKWMPTPAGG